LIELLVVMSIIAILLVMIAPAFTTLKSGGDVTSAANTIKGVLDQARTYAMANNTYSWVGFFEENVSTPSANPAPAGIGRIVMSIVASNDGTMIYDPNNPAKITTTKLVQVGKLTKIENVHLASFTDTPLGTGSTFATRPNVTPISTYRIGATTPPNSRTPFQYPVGSPEPGAQYTFVKAVQFSSKGEGRVDNNTDYTLQTAAEIGVVPTHGTTVANANPNLVPNRVAIQFTGAGGDVKIYRQ
jgi:type II secretory pathway pseudopilin PulG